MIEVEVNGLKIAVPTNPDEVKLSQAIEYSFYRSEYVKTINEFGETSPLAVDFADKALLGVFGEIFNDFKHTLSLGEYDPKSIRWTYNKFFYLLDSCILSYQPKQFSEAYQFTYKGTEWLLPMVNVMGKPNPDISYGQYVEAMESMRMIKEGCDLEIRFTAMLRLISSLVVEKGFNRDKTILNYREIADTNAYFFEDINMVVGYDIDFFLNASILI